MRNKEIGWSKEASLLWEIQKQIEKNRFAGAPVTTTTTTTA